MEVAFPSVSCPKSLGSLFDRAGKMDSDAVGRGRGGEGLIVKPNESPERLLLYSIDDSMRCHRRPNDPL